MRLTSFGLGALLIVLASCVSAPPTGLPFSPGNLKKKVDSFLSPTINR